MARSIVSALALCAGLAAAVPGYAQTLRGRPTLEVVVDNHAPSAASELAAARTRARFIFGDAGIQVTFLTRQQAASSPRAGLDPIYVVLLDEKAADRLIAGDPRRLGFAIPPANRVYVHYERVHLVARNHGVEPGWFLGAVIAHELGHVLLQGAPHAAAGLMAKMISPDSAAASVFSRQESQHLRDRLRTVTTLAQR
jgi:hypothetical protein